MMLMLQHPSIVRLWDVVLENAQNRVVLIEELVTGGDMFDLVSARGGLAEAVSLSLSLSLSLSVSPSLSVCGLAVAVRHACGEMWAKLPLL